MKSYFRVMLGARSVYAAEAFAGNFICADFEIPQDLSGDLFENWRAFNKKFIPIFLANHPGKSKISAGLACGALWTISKGFEKGDIVLSPDGTGAYHVGEVNGDYFYAGDQPYPHRRQVKWMDQVIRREDMSEALRSSTGTWLTVSRITQYAIEIEKLLGSDATSVQTQGVDHVEDPVAFAMEKHLEDFLVKNWAQTDLGKYYDIFTEDGLPAGQQYPTDTGPMDILAVKKDKSELLVVELKRGRASDVVVGQVLRYMGFVLQELAEPNQTVRGAIIALDDDQRIRRALAVAPNVEFYRYEMTFRLIKG